MGDLHEALTLHAQQDGGWAALADPRYEALNGMFGGWTAAMLLQAMMADPGAQGDPVALTVNYLSTVPVGETVWLRAARVGGGRSVHHWRAELLAPGVDGPCATATAVLGVRRPTAGYTEPTMPDLVPWEGLAIFHPPGTWGEHAEVRTITGDFRDPVSDTRSLAWVREISERRVDELQLALLSDAYAPRPFFLEGGGPRMSSTLTMSVHFHATPSELGEVGTGHIVNEAIGTRGVDGASGQQARLWSASGALLATTEQVCWYR